MWNYVTLEILIAVNMMFTVSFEVTPSSLVDRYQRFGGTCYFEGEGVYLLLPN
jgi:hypothetical protein